MSRSVRVFRHVQKQIPELLLCQDFLVLPPTQHIVRGFLLEGTSQKGRVYLWRVLTPLFRPMRHIVLDHSNRVSRGAELYIREGAYREAAEEITAIIEDGHLEYIRRIRRPADFMRHISWKLGNPMILFRIDLAFTHYLIGNFQQALEGLRSLDREVDQLPAAHQDYVLLVVKKACAAIQSTPERLGLLLQQWEDENVARFCLEPTRPPFSLSGVGEEA